MRGVVGIEQSRSPDDLTRAMRMIYGWLREPEDGDLDGVFRDWAGRDGPAHGVDRRSYRAARNIEGGNHDPGGTGGAVA